MRARSAIFDLYGDHLLARDGWAPVQAIVRLTGAVDVAPPATRTAISRMTREGWLAAREDEGVRGYVATARAQARLAAAWTRIFQGPDQDWDDQWHVVVTGHVSDRSARDRLAASLQFLGYGRLGPSTWVAPRASAELGAATAGVPLHSFHATLEQPGAQLAAQLWDLDELAASYSDFLLWLREQTSGVIRSGESAYATRALIVHNWRKFLFTDPALPARLLPDAWPGQEAAERFREATAALWPGATAYVAECLADPGARR